MISTDEVCQLTHPPRYKNNAGKTINAAAIPEPVIKFLNQVENDSDAIPDIIFLDLNMPGKDGFAFLTDFENFSEAVKVKCKIVVLSSSISPDDINRASTNPYVIKYVNKPLSEKYLSAIVL